MITKEDIEQHKRVIDRLNAIQLGRIRMFSPHNHIYFTVRELQLHFENRFQSLGGMTKELNKLLLAERLPRHNGQVI